MFSFSFVLALVALLPTAFTTSIILPLYIYPAGDGLTSWDLVFSVAESYPNTNFLIIVNPDSGPGHTPDGMPSSDYQEALLKLNKYPNVQTLGYVRTGYGSQPEQTVKDEISQYASWWNGADPDNNFGIDGIFFDETKATADNYGYMTRLAGHAYNANPSPDTQVVFNPGAKPEDERWYHIADQIVVFECAEGGVSTCPEGYQGSSTLNEIVPQGYEKQASVIVNRLTADVSKMQAFVKEAKSYNGDGIGSIYFTQDLNYFNLNVLEPQAAALNGSSSPLSTSTKVYTSPSASATTPTQPSTFSTSTKAYSSPSASVTTPTQSPAASSSRSPSASAASPPGTSTTFATAYKSSTNNGLTPTQRPPSWYSWISSSASASPASSTSSTLRSPCRPSWV